MILLRAGLFPGFTAVFVLNNVLIAATLLLVVAIKEPEAGSSYDR